MKKSFPQVHIIEASAGSGKTYCLAKKYISLLLNPYINSEMSEILAITFTNKAAQEMKERVLEFLKKIALDKFKNSMEKEELISDLEEKDIEIKANEVIEKILKNYNFFQVQTIDSFINTILYSCAYRLGFSVDFKTEKYHQFYISYSLDRLIDRANADKKILKIFQEFIHQYLLIENRTGWFPKQSILDAVTDLFTIYNRQRGYFISNELEAKSLLKKKREIIKKLKELYQKIPPQTDKRFVDKLKTFLGTHPDNFNIQEISAYFKRKDFPVHKGGLIPAEISKLWDKIRNDLREICEIESLSLFNSYVEIFNRVLLEIEDFIKGENLILLDSLNRKAYSLFHEENLGIPELYYRLSLRLKYFLIDEFQDTSRIQWENILAMIEDALSRGGSLFYVGDKKQAIYRFRGGDVSLFKEVKNYFKNFDRKEELLEKNYRSRKEIVEFNNFIFSEENLKRFLLERNQIEKEGICLDKEDIERIIEIFKDSKQKYFKDKGYVKLEFLPISDREERDEIVKERLVFLIKKLQKKGYLLKDITILVRKNSEVELLTSWLLENAISVESEKTLNVRENPYIKEIISFLRFLSHPVDNLSFSSFILGDIFTKKANIKKDSLYDFIFKEQSKSGSSYLYIQFRKNHPSLWKSLIEEFFKSVGFIPLYELLVTIYEKFSVFENFSEYQGFFMKFLELVKEKEEDYPDLSSFLNFFEEIPAEELYVNVTKTDAVKIMTIHKAKGLGFPVVILPFLELTLESPKQIVVSEENRIRLLYLKKIYVDYSPYLYKLYKNEYINFLIDELNTLYVALTRAEDQLYIFFTQLSGQQKNFAYLLFPPEKLEYGDMNFYEEKEEKLPSTVEIPGSNYKNWIEMLKEEFIEESILKGRDEIIFGEVVHKVLSYIGNLYLKEKDLVLEEAMKKTEFYYPYFDKYGLVKESLSKLLKNAKFKRFFEVEEGLVFSEMEIVDSLANTHRIDRVVVKGEEVLIVDYKTGKERIVEDSKQVKEYIEILKEIYPEKKIKGFLLYLDDFSLKELWEK